MSEQAQTITAPEAATTPAASNGVSPDRERRPNRGISHWGKKRNAATRIPELLSDLKVERQKRAQDHIEAQAALAAADAEITRLKGELLDACQERDVLKQREEDRIFQFDEDQKAAAQVARDHRLLCFRALVDVAHQTGAYRRHPDFDTRVRRAETLFSTELLEAILMFPAQIAPEMAYSIASAGAAQKLSSLGLIPKFFLLANMAREIADQIKFQLLRESL